jgi:hypothetical protein
MIIFDRSPRWQEYHKVKRKKIKKLLQIHKRDLDLVPDLDPQLEKMLYPHRKNAVSASLISRSLPI